MFRNRQLTSNSDIYEHNTWDNVIIEDDKLCKALEKINLDNKTEKTQKYEQSLESWENFYTKHNDNFFKDRKWIEHEFKEMKNHNKILEIGCGVGNSLAWLYENDMHQKTETRMTYCKKSTDKEDKQNGNKQKLYVFDMDETQMTSCKKSTDKEDKQNGNKQKLYVCDIDETQMTCCKKSTDKEDKQNGNKQTVYGCDFSTKAIKIAGQRFPYFNFFLHDICSDNCILDDLNKNSISCVGNFDYSDNFKFDCVILIFTLSAIDPKLYGKILQKINKILKPGGKVYFKDYSFLDMIQFRYKSEQIVKKNFYKRNDGTFTHFFRIEELQTTFEKHGFSVETLFEDKRMKVNRKSKKEMYRIMLQGIFVKKK